MKRTCKSLVSTKNLSTIFSSKTRPPNFQQKSFFSHYSFTILFLLLILQLPGLLHSQTAAYLSPKLSIQERTKDLISKLSLEEKIGQLVYNGKGIARLNIPAYNWWSEALHGVARSGTATVFPQAIGMAASFNDSLLLEVATVISDEARAMYNITSAKNISLQYGGLSFWTPNINIFRDPRWGRGQETYGEDPFLTTHMGLSMVNGLQGNHPVYLKLAACAKHYAVHSGPERLRHEFDAKASLQDMYETYLPAFKALVNAKVEAVMCAYNRTNTEPCCGNTYLLQDVLRKKWNFKGHVVSDCWAITDIHAGHKIVKNNTEAAAYALTRGVNLNCGNEYEDGMLSAVQKGLVTEKQLDSALMVVLGTKFKLGLFDPPGSNPYDQIPASVINSDKHRALSRKMAQQSIVLLKNNGVLPLKKDLPKYFVTGPNATSIEALHGNYFGVNNKMTTFLEGVVGAVAPGCQVQYAPGTLLDRPNVNPIDWASGEAANSNATIMVMGITGMLEGEEGESIASPTYGDRLDYNIPQNQIDFLRKMKGNNNKPVIAVITGGSPMNLASVDSLADAVLLAWYPGEEGGNAVADVLFGDVSPAGRLPITFPRSFSDLPDYTNYNMKGRTYRYMTKTPMYPFGFGLSYAAFSYNKVTAPAKIKKGANLQVSVNISNTEKRTADEVVQLYVVPPTGTDNLPLYSLKGFKRITLAPSQSAEIVFTLTPEHLSFADEMGTMVQKTGKYKIIIGGSLPIQRSSELGAAKPVEAIIEVAK